MSVEANREGGTQGTNITFTGDTYRNKINYLSHADLQSL